MKTKSFPRSRGSAFICVIIFVAILGLLASSIIKWSLTERRLNMRNAYWLEARNASEATAEYGFSQIVTNFNSYSTPPTFSPSGSNPLVLPPSSFFSGGNVVSSAYNASTNPNGIELIGGTLASVPTSGSLYYIDPNNPDNKNDTLAGQWVFRRDVQVLAKATVVPPNGSPITTYVTEKVSIRGAPLFSHAIFYSANDLEIAPGPVMNIYGPVHVNGNLFVASQGSSLNFYGPVSTSGNVYHAWENANTAAQGSGGETLGQTPVKFVNNAGTLVNLNSTGLTTGWNDSTGGASNGVSGLSNLSPLVTTATNNSFRQNAAQTWGGNLQTAAMGVQAYYPISFDEVIDASGNKPDPHALIDAPDTTLSTSDHYYDAKHQLELQKMSMQSGLYIKVTVSPGAAGAADTADVKVYGPAGSAATGAADAGPNGGALLPTVPAGLVSLTGYTAHASGNATTTAQQVSYSATGSGSNWKIKTTTKTGGTLTQTATRNYNGASVADTISGNGTFSGGASGNVTGTASYSSSANALAAAPGHGVTVVTPSGSPTTTIDSSTLTLDTGMYDQRRDMGVDQVVLDMAQLRKAVQEIVSSGSSGSTANAIKKADGGTWTDWNGAVYLDIQCPNYQTSNQSASVVLVNGRVTSGQSLIPSYGPGGNGLTIATNAPVYIKGNFNADGSNITATGSATTPDDGKDGSAGHTSSESPVCIAADAVTILSNSWNDATSLSTGKPAATDTEVAAALLVGLQPTSDTANSGGAHNLPRFLENWKDIYATIRGSLVTMYSCKVATQPWSTSYYGAPNRNWGFDKIFQNGNYPPITPKVMSYRRVDFTDLNATTYAAAKHSLWPSIY